jgi:hypothetical protein
VRTVRLTTGAGAGVALANDALVLTSAPEEALGGARLQSAIDSLL